MKEVARNLSMDEIILPKSLRKSLNVYGLKEAREVLGRQERASLRTVTKSFHWDIPSKSWEDVPDSQKRFAPWEGHAHLEHFHALGEVSMEEEGGIFYDCLLQEPRGGRTK